MKKMIKFLKAFSLVELMISLIVISLISAAFAPVITKKLSNGIITVGSFGGNNNSGNSSGEVNCPSNITCEAGYYLDGTCKCQPCSDPNCTYCAHNACSICNDGFTLINGKCENLACHDSGGLPTKACCESIGAMFIDKKYTGTTDLCMMKYNAGDDENIYKVGTIDKIYHPKYPKIGVQMNQAGVATCTSSGNCCWKGKTSNGTNSYPGYSASNRTVCQQAAATKICNNWAFPGTVQGAWRLLTTAEAQKLATAITAETSSAPVLTKYLGSDGLQLCDQVSTNYGSNKCPSLVACNGARNNKCIPYEYHLSETKQYFDFSNGVLAVAKDTDDNYAYSVRCVTKNVNTIVSPIDTETTSHNDVEPRNQEDCPNGTLFINKKFLGGGSNLCVMQYNATDDVYKMGDKAYHPPYVKFGVKVVDVNVNCDTGSCCWKGNTSTGTISKFNDNYPPNNRSVCQQPAAVKICSNWAYGNSKPGHWRLMTTAEAKTLSKYINVDGYYPGSESFAFFTKYLDSDGLQLCDQVSTNYGSNKCPSLVACNGARNNKCIPYEYHLSETKQYFDFSNGVLAVAKDTDDNYAYSVRCVSDNIRKKIPEVTKTYETNEPRNQGDCDKYNALFIDKEFLNGASRNICMTKYNFADEDAVEKGKPYIGSNKASDYDAIGVKVVNANENCSAGACCWKGTTSTTNTANIYNYTSDKRTVCKQPAATALCLNWNPDNTSYKKWRLMTTNEAKGLTKYITAETKYSSFLSKYLESNGLQLCDANSANYGSNKCPSLVACNGARNNKCIPHEYHLSETKQYFDFSNGVATVAKDAEDSYAYSVRCISDTVEWAK